MPTLRQNISYVCGRAVVAHRASIIHLVKSAIVLLLIAFFLEVFVFNFNYFASASYNTVDLAGKIDLAEGSDGDFRISSADTVLEFSDLNTEIKNIHIDFPSSQPAQTLTLKIQFTDEAHQTYFDSTEYTVGIPEVDVSTMSSQSEYINLQTTGLVDNLRIEIVGDDVSYPILLSTIELNAQRPFVFSQLRFFIVLFAGCLIFMFRPKSSIYRISITGRPRATKVGITAFVVVELALTSAFLFFGSNLVGVATSNYNYGSWNGTSIVNTFEVGGDNAQQYADLARAMSKGQLYLDEEPPQWLQDMDDPYDKGARDEAQKETGEDYLFDVAYYEGHYYVYFGVVPAILFYLPFYVLTGASFPTAIGVLIAAIAFILGCSALLYRFARNHFKRVSLGLYLLLQVPLVFCCGMLYLVKFPTFYSLPIMCGLAFSVWGLYFWMRGRASATADFDASAGEDPPTDERAIGRKSSGVGSCLCYLAGSLCMAVVLGCRPQLVALSLLAFPLFWRPYISRRRLLTAAGVREFVCMIAPYVVIVALLMVYNYARFGSPFDFGANYNLTMNDMTQRGMDLGRIAPAIFAYFLQAPNVAGTFPFIQATEFLTTYMGQTIKEVTFGGIFACLPLLWVLLFSRRILALRIARRSTHTITGVIVVLLVTGVVIALLDAEMAGILQRYYADFSFMFLAAAVLLIFIVNENLRRRSTSYTVFMRVLPLAVAFSVLYSTLVCAVPETGWYSDVYSWAWQDIVKTFQFWT